MSQVLSEDVSRTLTEKVWDKWIDQGIESRKMIWPEVNALAKYFLKVCTEHGKDYKEYDFYNLLDPTLNFNENRAELENIVGYDISSKEKEAVGKLKDYLTEEQLSEYTDQEKTVIEELQTSNKTLQKKIGQITKKIDTQTIDPESLKKELDEMQNKMTLMYARFEQIPNLPQLVAALEKSQNFKKVGEAIRPITPNLPVTPQEPPKPKPKFTLSGWLKTKHIATLDLFAAIMVTTLFAGISYGLVSWLSFTWSSIVGLSVIGLAYVVVVRLVAGGALN